MLADFHFGEPIWLWLLAVLLLFFALHRFTDGQQAAVNRLKNFIDPHLLPHLLRRRSMTQRKTRWPLLLWCIIWALGTIALAGPRWNYTDVHVSKPDRSLVILLDLSKSMDAQDVKPSRIGRAREEIGDLLDAEKGLNVSLVAFAAIPHLVVPLTEDMGTIRYLLPSLDPSLITLQGSHLKAAFAMAGHMLDAAKAGQKSILIVSDGGFEDTEDAEASIPAGIQVYTLAVGTTEGAPIPINGGFIKDAAGATVMAKREDGKLQAIASAGQGLAVVADYSDADTRALLARIDSGSDNGTATDRTVRVWEERFYICALLMALLVLPLFRKGFVIPAFLFFAFLLPAHPSRAGALDWFRNPEQQGAAAFNHGDYDAAAKKFGTPYQRGVAQYKAGQYDQAAQSFDAAKTANGIDAQYNLGNAQLRNGDPQGAIDSYQSVLKSRPNDKDATHNLDIAKKLLQQKQQQKNQNQKQQSDNKQDRQQKNQSSNGQDQKNSQGSQPQQNQQGQQQQSGDQQKSQPQDNNNAPKQNSPQNKQQGQKQQPDQQKPNQPQKTPQQPPAQPQKQSQPASQQTDAQPRADDHGQNAQGNPDGTPVNQTQPPSAKDVDADQWLSRAVSDPSPFLKKQFDIDAQKSGQQQEDAQPW